MAAADPLYSPASWLARAQPLLAQAGAPRDLQLLRRAFRSFGRRVIDRVDTDVATAMDRLREQRARLEDVLSAQRDALERDAVRPEQGMHVAQSAVDQTLAAVRDAEEQLIASLERSLVDRQRIGQLVAVSQEIASIERLDELIVTIPRLALVFCPADAAELLEVEADGSLTLLSRSGAALVTPRSRIEQEARATLSAGATRVEDDGRSLHRTPNDGAPRPGPAVRLAVIPLRQGGRNLVLIVERAAPGAQLTERDLEQLTVYGSLAGTSLARSRSNAALRESAARDAASVAAIRDGVLALDTEGVVRSINGAATRILGIRREDALGRRLRDIPGFAPLGLALTADPPPIGEVVMVPRGDVVIRAQAYEGGVVANFHDFATAQRIAQKLVESAAHFTFEDLVGSDRAFLEALELARRAAQSDAPILITGESGTGKEMLAQAIHSASRSSAPFVGINVGAIPRELLESELFGYEGGAFTGARSGGHAGKFELAGRGTLLLDEIGDMPLEMQGKLLRVLQERIVQRLGGSRDIALHARVIATSHRDLDEAVKAGRFRLDLFHRLRVVHLRLPPLRQRRGDIPQLVDYHLRKYAERMRRRTVRMAPPVIAALEAYDWPGNVRELANLAEGEVSLLPPDQDLIVRVPASIEWARSRAGISYGSQTDSTTEILRLAEVERQACENALLRFGGNVAGAARALGVSKGTLYNKIRHYQIVLADLSRRVRSRDPER
jgi:transcriptional regulator with PAS, ATPase and Fis domain